MASFVGHGLVGGTLLRKWLILSTEALHKRNIFSRRTYKHFKDCISKTPLLNIFNHIYGIYSPSRERWRQKPPLGITWSRFHLREASSLLMAPGISTMAGLPISKAFQINISGYVFLLLTTKGIRPDSPGAYFRIRNGWDITLILGCPHVKISMLKKTLFIYHFKGSMGKLCSDMSKNLLQTSFIQVITRNLFT